MHNGEEIETRVLPTKEEDLSQFQFGKFAATYFQSNANATFVRKPLRYPLLPHQNLGDQIVSLFHVYHKKRLPAWFSI